MNRKDRVENKTMWGKRIQSTLESKKVDHADLACETSTELE